MTITKFQAGAFAVAAVLLAATFFLAGRSCDSVEPVVVVEQRGIDAGPGEREIEARLDASIQAAQRRIEQIEDKFSDDIAAFDDEQRAEYDRLRGGGDLEATARHLSEWSRRRRRDGGR